MKQEDCQTVESTGMTAVCETLKPNCAAVNVTVYVYTPECCSPPR